MDAPAKEQIYNEINDLIKKWIVCHEVTFAALDSDDLKSAALNLHETKELLGKAVAIYRNIAKGLGL